MAGHLNLLVNLAPERSLPNRYFSTPLVVFYTTVAPEPFLVVYFSVALFRKSPWADVIRRSALRCPDFPHIANAIRDCSCTLKIIITQNYIFLNLSNISFGNLIFCIDKCIFPICANLSCSSSKSRELPVEEFKTLSN